MAAKGVGASRARYRQASVGFVVDVVASKSFVIRIKITAAYGALELVSHCSKGFLCWARSVLVLWSSESIDCREKLRFCLATTSIQFRG